MIYDPDDIVVKTHIEHAISFVKHEVLEVFEINRSGCK
jgi:hypothetical protein